MIPSIKTPTPPFGGGLGPERRFNTRQAAALLQTWGLPVSAGGLARLRHLKRGPAFIRLKGSTRIFYTLRDLIEYAEGVRCGTLDFPAPAGGNECARPADHASDGARKE